MDYEKEYKEALERARVLNDRKNVNVEAGTTTCEYIFPVLKESKDEEIRKQIRELLLDTPISELRRLGIDLEKAFNWVESQGKCETDCHHNHQDSSRPNGGIVLEDFNGGEGFYKLNLGYLNKKQVEEVEEMVRMWNKESKTSNEDIKNCIGMCLTDADEQRFKDYNTSLKDCLNWLKNQGSETYSQKDAKCFDYDDGKRDEFKDAIQVGDHVTRNEEGVLVNLSQLKRNLRKESTTMPKKVDLEKLQKIQLEHIGSLDIQIATRYDQNSTLFTMTDYPLTRELYVHKLPWGADNTEEFKKINKELKMLL